MKKILAVAVFAVVCLFAAPAFAQEEPVAEVIVRNGDTILVESEPESVPTARELLEQGLTVAKGATANVNLNENVVNVPDEMTVNGTIDIGGGRLSIERTDRTWCEHHPMACTFIIVGVVGTVVGGGFYVADQAGMFDTTNTVGFEK